MTNVLALVLGAMTWTLLEYCIHRWMGHDKRLMPNPFATEHVRHHSEGNYFAPGYKKAGAAVVLACLITGPAVWLVGVSAGVAYVAGLIALYIGYEVLHRLEHIHHGFTAYGRWLRRHHFHHHFHNPKKNHGVTSPIWDVVFGSYEKAAPVIRVPEKLKMDWLTDPISGDVWARHADHYVLRRRRAH